MRLRERGLCGQDIRPRGDRRQVFQRVVAQEALQHGQRFGGRRVAGRQAHQEAVQLRFGQGKRALNLYGVLCGEHQKRPFQRPCDAALGDLPLFHALQKRRLRARRGAVDFVRQQDVREHRPRLERKRSLPHVVHAHARHVRRKQVGRELDACEAAVQGPGQRLGHDGLARARHIFQQHMAAGHQRAQQQLHDIFLAHDDPAHVFANAPGQPGNIRHRSWPPVLPLPRVYHKARKRQSRGRGKGSGAVRPCAPE